MDTFARSHMHNVVKRAVHEVSSARGGDTVPAGWPVVYDVGDKRIAHVATPTEERDAAHKAYVDGACEAAPTFFLYTLQSVYPHPKGRDWWVFPSALDFYEVPYDGVLVVKEVTPRDRVEFVVQETDGRTLSAAQSLVKGRLIAVKRSSHLKFTLKKRAGDTNTVHTQRLYVEVEYRVDRRKWREMGGWGSIPRPPGR